MEESSVSQLSILDSSLLLFLMKQNTSFPQSSPWLSVIWFYNVVCPALLSYPMQRTASQIKMDLKRGLFDKHSARLTSRTLLQFGDLFRIWVLQPSHEHSAYNRQVKSKCMPALTWPRLWRLKSRPHVNSVWCSTVSSKGLGLEKSQNL